MDGRPVHVRDMKGRAFVLNLWATWCPPCRREMPMMVDVASTTPVPVLFVNQGESAGRIEDFLEERNFKGVRMLRDPDGLVARAIGSPALPTTLFIDAGGKVRSRYLGELSRAALTAAINDLERHPT